MKFKVGDKVRIKSKSIGRAIIDSNIYRYGIKKKKWSILGS